ncbi:MAG: glutamine synthetase, partial [Erysipelotrichaceae bacterium]|nr:glutamine synthetase [Erysipelotrichaceae bacterium]
MNYTVDEILQYVEEEDVKFIRIAFVDVFGKQKNIAIMPHELERAFKYGVAIDASSISGFSDEAHSDLLLFPDADTITILPWRPEHGKVVRMFCKIVYPDGRDFECDSRQILINAINTAKEKGLTFFFGAEQEFYLFKLDENGNKTTITYDKAGYMDIAPDDKGENIRREICLTLEQMGILPESSHHEAGPGQNEIDFRYSDALSAADNVITFQSIVRTTAFKNGLYASFAPKP